MASMDDSNFDQDGYTSPDYHIPPPELTLLQRLLFRRPERYVEHMRRVLAASAKGMGRHPTQEEVNILCHLTYKEAQTVAWAVPASAMLAAALTWTGRGTYRFPFFQPKFKKFSPDVFPTAMAPHLQGRLANRMWHITRFSAYFVFSSLAVSPFIGSYATTVAITTARRDERLSQFRKDMKPERLVKSHAETLPLATLIRHREMTAALISQLEKHVASFPAEEEIAAQSDHPDKTEFPDRALRLALIEGQRKIEEQRRILAHIDKLIEKRRDSGGDDTSAQNKDYVALSDLRTASGYTLPMEPNRAPPMSYSSEPPSSEGRPGWGWGQKGSSSQQGSSSNKNNNSSAFDDLEIDDASPLAPTPRSQSSVQSGSAWDRVRQASKQPLRASGGYQAQQSESEAYYTYDAVDKDKEAEKDKAQAEFDAMIERERRGDTGRGGERNNRW
ncbi:hypothetical protein CGRA01v4_13543 [Colletotrichum graminicola]|uniref:Uncharacterized protein n=1 Tax=Colletotrichum graminicola (strain M1.001 / M2 / FGSC 10212) TaxID=645133 RepID=E3QRR0_COLGM|nr:uncharacterized protein GLRG_08827 [Colletotrichum graminicola M1.001]EFQ33548.1 hypothetical protein GLRG_08827 [Colletotrichum graminicola M1.001]WDK22253.1 hypothetical protein CGRA01v4_13543 [Colletotrichum graminicola]